MAIQIITDSASDILPAEAARMGIKVIPVHMEWDGVAYLDGVDMDQQLFYQKLEESDTLPSTSLISPSTFETYFRECVEAGDTVLAIPLSSKLSGTCQSAMIAAEEFPGKVYVVDSLNAAMGMRLLVQMALRYVHHGLAIEEIVRRLEEDRGRIRLLARLETLEYLKKGGRIPPAVALVGGILSIKPVITVTDGAVELLDKARGSKNANNLLRKFMESSGGIDFDRPFCLAYSGLSGLALQQYMDDNFDLWGKQTSQLPIVTIGAVIGTHVGPGAIGMAFFEKK